jgi:hypothetical protein
MLKVLSYTIILVLFYNCSSKTLPDQQKLLRRHNCDSMFSSISKQWRLDSLGKRGFRKKHVEMISSCLKMPIYPDYLLNKLGKANKVWSTDLETVYVYYLMEMQFLNARTQIKYIAFRVKSPENYTVKIDIGEISQ